MNVWSCQKFQRTCYLLERLQLKMIVLLSSNLLIFSQKNPEERILEGQVLKREKYTLKDDLH